MRTVHKDTAWQQSLLCLSATSCRKGWWQDRSITKPLRKWSKLDTTVSSHKLTVQSSATQTRVGDSLVTFPGNLEHFLDTDSTLRQREDLEASPSTHLQESQSRDGAHTQHGNHRHDMPKNKGAKQQLEGILISQENNKVSQRAGTILTSQDKSQPGSESRLTAGTNQDARNSVENIEDAGFVVRKDNWDSAFRVGDHQERKMSFDELLALDTKLLTRTQKRDLERHLSPEDKEALRKARISHKNKGKSPWNVGRSHSEETKLKIGVKTKLAMQRPEVLEKLRANHHPRNHSQETKDKISRSLRARSKLAKKIEDDEKSLPELSQKQGLAFLDRLSGVSEGNLRMNSVSEFAQFMPPSFLDRDRLARNATSKLLVKHFSGSKLRRIISAAEVVLAGTESESSEDEESIPYVEEEIAEKVIPYVKDEISEEEEEEEDILEEKEPEPIDVSVKETQATKAGDGPAKREEVSEEPRNLKSAAMKKKWADPEYRLEMMRKRQIAQEKKNKETGQLAKPKKEKSAKKTLKAAEKKVEGDHPKKPRQSKKDERDQISRAMLDRIKEQEMEILRKQNLRRAKLQVAKELVAELEDVLQGLPSQDELGSGEEDLKASIAEAEQLLKQAKSRVKALEEPFSVEHFSTDPLGQDSEKASKQERLQSAMFMLNMDPIKD